MCEYYLSWRFRAREPVVLISKRERKRKREDRKVISYKKEKEG
jgi:hypothetical protein